MTAARLRAAAAVLREVAEGATPGPWWDRSSEHGQTAPHVGEFGWYVPGSPAGETEDSPQGRADAAYIATMSPPVALAVAAWLEQEAWDHDRTESRGIKARNPHPNAVADAVLGDRAEVGS